MIADLDTVAEPARSSDYRAASERGLEIICCMADYVACSSAPGTAIWACIYAMGLPTAEGVSLTTRAESLGVSVAALSKRVREFQRLADIGESAYSYRKDL